MSLTTTSALLAMEADASLRSDRFAEGLDKNPFIDSQDILSKAVDFKLKIWHLESRSIARPRRRANR